MYSNRPTSWSDFWAGLGIIAVIVIVLGLIVAGVGALANSGGQDFAGNANQFVIEATVSGTTYNAGTGSGSVTVTDIHVIEAHGAAVSWFMSAGNFWSANHAELQNNFTDANKHLHIVGKVSYESEIDIPIDIPALEPGCRVRVQGTISDTKDGSYTQTRARFSQIIYLTSS